MIFARRQDARREEDGPVRLRRRGLRAPLRPGPPACGCGPADRRAAPRPRASARQGAAGRCPTVGGCAQGCTLSGLLWRSGVPVTHLSRMASRCLRPIRPGGPENWRAAGAPLKDIVEKVVTGKGVTPLSC